VRQGAGGVQECEDQFTGHHARISTQDTCLAADLSRREKARSVDEPLLSEAIQLMLKIENLRQRNMQTYIDKRRAPCPKYQEQVILIQEPREEIEKIITT